MRILLGCGDEHRPGWVHVDRWQHSPHVDVAHDLNKCPWPFEDDAAERIEAIDVLEHLDNPIAVFDECWRILEPGGRLFVRVPRWTSENVARDPTHRRGYHPDTFRYLDPETDWWRRYGRFYTDRYWRVVALRDGDNIEAELEPRKDL